MTTQNEIRQHFENVVSLDAEARIEYWQRLGTKSIFDGAEELVRQYCEEHGIDPRVDKKIESFRRGPLPKEK